jgi:hypothetical protein
MKSKYLSSAAGAVLAVTAMMAGVARADDLPQTKARQRLSVTQGFGGASWPVLHRKNGADPTAVSADLIAKLSPAGASETTMAGNTLRTAGDQWSLEVSGDGSAAEYRDLAVEARAHVLSRPTSEQMSAAALEQQGRAFIATRLATQIGLGANEELVALRADHRFEGGQDLGTGATTNAVVANRIVFGRLINGVPVVGNGSKVILTFANDGSLESFRYDWPNYEADSTQTVVDAGEVLSRVQRVMGARNGVTPARSRVAVPSGRGAPYPLAITPNAQLQSMECGYYDAGSNGRKAQSVQPGCTYLAVSQDASGMRQGVAGAVPAGTQFGVDAAWMETQILGRN